MHVVAKSAVGLWLSYCNLSVAFSTEAAEENDLY